MAGTSEHRLEETIELTKYAEDIGADCVLIITPYYMKTSESAIKTIIKRLPKLLILEL